MKIKKLICIAALLLVFCSASAAAADMVSYNIDELDLSLGIPTEYNYVFTRDMSDDDPILADWGMTKTELFQNDSLYLEALTEDQNAEIIVTMVKNDWSEMYYDFNNLENQDLMELAEECLMHGDSPVNMEYSEYSIFDRHRQAKYIKATGVFTKGEVPGNALQYVTVINGNAYTVTFDFYTENLTEEQVLLSEQVVSSVNFDHVVQQKQGDSTVIYIVIIAVMLIIILILLFIIRKRNYTLKIQNESEAVSAAAESKPIEESPSGESDDSQHNPGEALKETESSEAPEKSQD